MFKLSQASKMPCKSFSTQAVETCPGSIGKDGQLVDACKACYANSGTYLWPATKAVRALNKEGWQEESFVADMVKAIGKDRWFRWFDSGDVYSLGLAEKVFQVMVATPNTMHWLSTRMHKFPKFKAVLEAMAELPNVRVRYSSDSVLGEFGPEHGSTIIPPGAPVPEGVTVCQAPSQGGKCLECRACWSKDVPVVGYIGHGRSIGKVIKLALAKV